MYFTSLIMVVGEMPNSLGTGVGAVGVMSV